jgi:hypothetical protein
VHHCEQRYGAFQVVFTDVSRFRVEYLVFHVVSADANGL